MRLPSLRARDPSIHRPSRPAPAAGPAGRPGGQPAVVLAPADPGRLRRRRPAGVGRRRTTTPCACSAPSAASGWASWPRTTASSSGSSAAKADLDAYLSADRWYQRKAGADAPRAIGYFSPGVRHHRRAAAVLRRPRHPRRRPPQGRQRPRRPAGGRRPALQAAATSSSRCRARAGSRRPTRSSTPTSCPCRCCARPTAPAPPSRSRCPAGPTWSPGSGSPQVGRVPLLLLDSDVEGNPDHYREITDRLYGGTKEHRLGQELLLGVGGVRALRAYSRITGAPAPEVFHTNEGHAGFLGLERIRELTVGEGGPKLDWDTALEVSRASTVFTTHTPVPAGIDRFPRELIDAVLRRATARRPASRSRACWRSAPRTTRAATPRVFNMAVMGFRLSQRANGVSVLHGHVSREMFNGLWPAFDEAEVPDRLDHQRRARPDLGRPRGHRAGRLARRRPRRRRRRRVLPRGRRGARHRDLGGQARAARAPGPRRPPPAGQVEPGTAASPRPSSAGSTPPSTPTC